MSEFVASNGVRIELEPNLAGDIYLTGRRELDRLYATAGPEGIDALREFFQHERDEELGRWRWPENPDYVVYPCSVRTRVIVLRENGVPNVEWVDQGDERPYEFCHAARAYFEGHPERKPWEDAKTGEVWALTVNGDSEESAWTVNNAGKFENPDSTYELTNRNITAGRRIWPES